MGQVQSLRDTVAWARKLLVQLLQMQAPEVRGRKATLVPSMRAWHKCQGKGTDFSLPDLLSMQLALPWAHTAKASGPAAALHPPAPASIRWGCWGHPPILPPGRESHWGVRLQACETVLGVPEHSANFGPRV